MNAFRQFMTTSNGDLLIKLPDEYREKRLEVIILSADEVDDSNSLSALKNKWKIFLSSLPIQEPLISDDEILAEIKEVRAKRYE